MSFSAAEAPESGFMSTQMALNSGPQAGSGYSPEAPGAVSSGCSCPRGLAMGSTHWSDSPAAVCPGIWFPPAHHPLSGLHVWLASSPLRAEMQTVFLEKPGQLYSSRTSFSLDVLGSFVFGARLISFCFLFSASLGARMSPNNVFPVQYPEHGILKYYPSPWLESFL